MAMKATVVARQWLCCEHVFIQTETNATITLEQKNGYFYAVRAEKLQACYKRVGWILRGWISCVEEGLNSSTVSLLVLWDDRKWTQCRGRKGMTGPPCSWEIMTLQVGGEKGLASETLKYCCESLRTPSREWLRWRGPAAIVNDTPIPSSESAPNINKPRTHWQ
jgi:hypothetical protein